MTELYVMQRYLCPDLLESAGILNFDSWASTFGKVTTKHQLAADGTIKLKESFSSFENLPELRALCGEFADILTSDKLELPRPSLKTGKAQLVVVPATPEQRAFVRELANRAKAIQDGIVEPYEDNLLKITGEARYFSLGNQALQAIYDRKGEEPPFEIPQDKDGKVDACIEKVAEIYKQTNDTKGVQIIFSDIAVNSENGNFSAYDYIKKELVESYGIPEDEVIFAPKSDSKNREDIFRNINSGKFRVVIASTETLGTGANIQQNLYALHHLDIPWKPSDFEQREGRILRQGNKFEEVEIYNYVTEGTMDSYLYQTVANKSRFIAQFLNNENVSRSMEDCDEKVLAYGEFQAQAEGNPEFRRFIELANEINELTMIRSEYAHETVMTQKTLEELPEKIRIEKDKLAKVSDDRKSADAIKEIILTKPDGITISDRKEMNAYLFSMIQHKQKYSETVSPVVKIGDFDISLEIDNFTKEMYFMVKGAIEYSVDAGTSEKQDNVQRLANFFEKTLAKREEEISNHITFLEENIKQAENRVAAPFPREKELHEKTIEYTELEARLSDVTTHEDEIFDPEDEPIVESAEERKERESFVNVDEDDLKPEININDEENNQNPNYKHSPEICVNLQNSV